MNVLPLFIKSSIIMFIPSSFNQMSFLDLNNKLNLGPVTDLFIHGYPLEQLSMENFSAKSL